MEPRSSSHSWNGVDDGVAVPSVVGSPCDQYLPRETHASYELTRGTSILLEHTGALSSLLTPGGAGFPHISGRFLTASFILLSFIFFTDDLLLQRSGVALFMVCGITRVYAPHSFWSLCVDVYAGEL